MNSPDSIPSGETKPERERRVFSFFAADAAASGGLFVQHGTIQSRDPPEPDIHCQVVGQGPIAFELAEILDEGSRKAMAIMEAAREALLSHHLSTSDLSDFQLKFAITQIKVGFRQDKPLRDLQAVIPALYEWLLHGISDDIYGYSIPLPTQLQEAIEYVSILFPGPPFIDIAYGLTITDATISVITQKLNIRKYSSTAPIELLVFAHDQPLIQYDKRQSAIAAAIVPLIDESIFRGHIRRVWIYDISRRKTDQAIQFVYPELRP